MSEKKSNLNLQIVAPEGEIFSGEVKSVVLPGCEGEFGVLPGHLALVTTLSAGIISVEYEDGSTESIAVDWGFAEVGENSVNILANGAVMLDAKGNLAAAIAKAKALLESSYDNKFAHIAVSKLEKMRA